MANNMPFLTERLVKDNVRMYKIQIFFKKFYKSVIKCLKISNKMQNKF